MLGELAESRRAADIRCALAGCNQTAEQFASLCLQIGPEVVVDDLGATPDGPTDAPQLVQRVAAVRRWSTRCSYSSASENCSSGNPAGWALISATIAVATPSSNSTPWRAAGRTTASSSADALEWLSANVPAATCDPRAGCCSGRSYRSARTVTTQRMPCRSANASVERNRSRSLLSAMVQHSLELVDHQHQRSRLLSNQRLDQLRLIGADRFVVAT